MDANAMEESKLQNKIENTVGVTIPARSFKSSVTNYYADSIKIDKFLETDVLMGRGKSVRPANVRFQHVVWQWKDEYEKARVGTKRLVVEKAIDQVCFEMNPPSRFIEKRMDGFLYMVPRERILHKTKRAFTDIVNGRVKAPPPMLKDRYFKNDYGKEDIPPTYDPTKSSAIHSCSGTSSSDKNEKEMSNDEMKVNDVEQTKIQIDNEQNDKQEEKRIEIQQQLLKQKMLEEEIVRDLVRQQTWGIPQENQVAVKPHVYDAPQQGLKIIGKKRGCKRKFEIIVKPRRRDSFDLEQHGIKFETLSSIIDSVLLSK